MSTETYGSFRIEFLHDEEGQILSGNSLFSNVYNFWSVDRYRFLLGTYERKVVKLEKIIKRKWKRQTSLTVINVLLRKIKEGDKAFDPTEYLEGGHKHFFQNLQEWKKNFEKSYLEQYPFLRQY